MFKFWFSNTKTVVGKATWACRNRWTTSWDVVCCPMFDFTVLVNRPHDVGILSKEVVETWWRSSGHDGWCDMLLGVTNSINYEISSTVNELLMFDVYQQTVFAQKISTDDRQWQIRYDENPTKSPSQPQIQCKRFLTKCRNRWTVHCL